LAAGLVLAVLEWNSRKPQPTFLSFRPGQPFEGVVKDSTYPVIIDST
jgi:hypothetical protein